MWLKNLLFLLTLCLVVVGNEDPGIAISYPDGNQILFDSKGFLVNKLAFIHVKFYTDMQGPLTLLDKIIADLENAYKADMKRANKPIIRVKTQEDITSIWGDSRLQELYQDRTLDSAAVYLILLEMFLRISRQLRGLLTAVPEKYDIHEASMIHARTKREIIGGIALGMSIWNSHRISTLESHLHNFSSQYNLLVESTSLLSDKHNQLAADVELMSRLLVIILNGNARKVLATSISVADRLRNTIDDVTSIITSGQQRKVSPRLINGDDLNQLFIAVSKKAKDLDCEMIMDQPSDLYEIEASYGYSQNGLNFGIYIHIPIVPKSQKLALLEHIPFPISFQSFATNTTLTPNTGPDKFLAVLPSRQTSPSPPYSGHVPHKYRVLSETEFQSCFKLRSYYLCAGRNTLRTDIGSSCIGSLWLKDKDLIIKNCDIKKEPLQEVAVKLSPREWLVLTPEPQTAPVLCGRDVIKSLRFERQTRVKLIEDCDMSLRFHHLTTDVNILYDFKLETHEWRYFGSVFDEIITKNDLINEIIEDVDASKEKYGLPDLTHLKHYITPSKDVFSEIWDAISSLNLFSWFGNVYTFLVIVLVIYIIYLAFSKGWITKCLCGDEKKKNNDLPIIRPMKSVNFSVSNVSTSSSSRLSRKVDEPQPPPYSSVVAEESEIPSAPLLASMSVLKTNSPLNCVVKSIRKGQEMKNFVCHHHSPESAQGCSGSFSQKLKKKS